jgi:broad specificity phosphatase PhoE
MAIDVIFETHATTEDNEQGRAAGWLPGRLSRTGRVQAEELGRRRRDDSLDAVFCSDLRRAIETAEIAFNGTGIPMLHDWRLRECDYGRRNGMPAADLLTGRIRAERAGGRRLRGSADSYATSPSAGTGRGSSLSGTLPPAGAWNT